MAADGQMPEREKKQAAVDGRKDGVAREVIRMEREAVIPILKPKLVMRLAYLIGEPPQPPLLPISLFTFCSSSSSSCVALRGALVVYD
jgi:hypothetical protein